MVAGLVGLVGSPASAATLVVDADGMASIANCNASDPAFTTITAAHAAAIAGDTITVCPGTYNESVTINKNNITLLGAKAGVPAGPDATPADRGTDESVVNGAVGGHVIRTNNRDTTIDGFTLNTNPASPQQSAVFTSAQSPRDSVVNNIMVGGAAVPTSNAAGINSASFSGHTLAFNNIRGFSYGIRADGTPTDAQTSVDSNYMTANTRYGFFTFGSVSNGHLITNNVIEMNNSGMLVAQGGHDISGNTVRDNTNSAIILFATPRTFGTVINDNELLDNLRGIYLFGDDPGAVDNEGHNNNIVGNAFGVLNLNTAEFDGDCNWWGSETGPTDPAGNPTGTGDSSTGNVDYRPWLDGAAPSGSCTVNTPPSEDACKKDGWMTYTDDEGRRFKNQGDCVSYVQTDGRNKADG